MSPARIAITPGEPAGIGPDVCLQICQQAWPCELIFIADPDLLQRRAEKLGLSIDIQLADLSQASHEHIPGKMLVSALPRSALPSTRYRPRTKKHYQRGWYRLFGAYRVFC